MKIVALVQARMGSTRLPNKVMKPINGFTMIELLLTRLARAKEIDQIIVATPVDERNIPLVEHVR
jgi:glutamate-1-semialdehyde 2,1-aminomutase